MRGIKRVTINFLFYIDNPIIWTKIFFSLEYCKVSCELTYFRDTNLICRFDQSDIDLSWKQPVAQQDNSPAVVELLLQLF